MTRPAWGVEISSLLSHQLQVVIRGQCSVFDLRAAGDGRTTYGVFVSVHYRTKTNFPCFIARGVELLLGHRHVAALTNTRRCEDFNDVGSRFFLLADKGANFVRRARLCATAKQRFS